MHTPIIPRSGRLAYSYTDESLIPGARYNPQSNCKGGRRLQNRVDLLDWTLGLSAVSLLLHISITHFDIHPDCPPNKQDLSHRIIIINLKLNIFQETKTVQQLTLYRNHLTQYIPAILLSSDQSNKNYIFQLTDENGKTVTH